MTAYAAAVTPDAPGAWIRHGEASGTAVVDAIGGASGTYVGGFTLGQPSLLLGETDTAVRFNGSTGYARFSKRAAFNLGNGPFSLECWMRLDSLPRSGTTAVVMDFGSRHAISRVEPDGLWIFRQNSVVDIAIATVRLAAGVLYHLVITRDASGVTKMYVNGVDVTPRSVTSTTLSNNAIDFNIGSADAGTSGNMLPGTVDESAIYPSVLSPARVTAHWIAGRSIILGGAVESNTAPAARPVKARTLGTAISSESATPSKAAKVRLLGAATSSESARAATARKARPLNLVTETSTARAAAARKRRTLSTAIEDDLAGALTPQLEAPPPDTEPPTFLTIDSVASTCTIASLVTAGSMDPSSTTAPLDQLATEVAIDA